MGRWASAVVDQYTRLAPLEATLGGATSSLPEHARQELISELTRLGYGRASAVEAVGPVAPAPSPSSSSTTAPPTIWILNLLSGVHHIRRPGEERSVCGWRFGRAAHVLLPPEEAPPQFPWAICASCAPEKHCGLRVS